jgi:vacuolar-type H+-ATPase subunit I/STV1
MADVATLERDLDAIRERVDHKRDRRKHWREVADGKRTALREHVGNVEEAREERDDNRERLVVVRTHLSAIELDGVSPDESEQYGRLNLKLESLVDSTEDLTALIHRELARIDELDKKKDHAAALRRDFGHELEVAIARRKRIAAQLKKAKQEASSPLGTPFFVVAEFDCHDGTPVPTASIPALKAAVQAYLLPLRSAFGSVHINSGFRTLTYNASIGGASMSVHVYNASWQRSPWAVAIDHVAAGASPSQVQDWHEGHTHPDGMGHYSSFTHVDNRNRIGWADSRWNGP